MAFDQTTRNRLQRFVNDARRVLEEEFTRQLQNDFGLDPNAGTVADLASLRHINDAQRETARILRDTLAHYTASGDMNATQGLDRIVREQAFTVLNRLAALRMAEARGLLSNRSATASRPRAFSSMRGWLASAWAKPVMPTGCICSACSMSSPKTCPVCSTATPRRAACFRAKRRCCTC